jgi:hypothetical protein
MLLSPLSVYQFSSFHPREAFLRKRLSAKSKKAFNTAVMDLAKYDRYFLTKHFHSVQSTEVKRETFITDSTVGFYVAINPRDEAPIITATDTVPEKKSKGGARLGAGRPMKKARYRQVQLQGDSIPGWLIN